MRVQVYIVEVRIYKNPSPDNSLVAMYVQDMKDLARVCNTCNMLYKRGQALLYTCVGATQGAQGLQSKGAMPLSDAWVSWQ